MLEDSSSILSIWASMNSWLTPTVLFVFLNLMIGTILISSTLSKPQQQQQPDEYQPDPQQPKPVRSPSVLHRLRSINLHSYTSQEPHPSTPITPPFKQTLDSDTHFPSQQTPPRQQILQQREILERENLERETLEREREEEEAEEEEQEEEEEDGEQRSLEEVYSQLTNRHVSRTTSDTHPASGKVPARLPAKMRKSASSKSAFGHFEEDDVVVETRRPATVKERKVTDGDDEVDAKADYFINKFKNELKLERMDSIIRYKEIVARGSGK